MKEERLLTVFGGISDGYIEESAPGRGRKTGSVRRKWGMLAACLCLAAAAAFAVLRAMPWRAGLSAAPQDRLLAAIRTDGILLDAQILTELPVMGRVAVYEQLFPPGYYVSETAPPPGSGARLEAFLGQLFLDDGEKVWYRVKDMEELKYLISRDRDGELKLWEFHSFVVLDGLLARLRAVEASEQELADAEDAIRQRWPDADLTPYTYGEVYRMIFAVESAEDLAYIVASPSTANNQPLGLEIQKQVGTHRFNDREVISRFYDATANVVCFGRGDQIGFRDYRYSYSFSTDAANKLDSGEETWATRYLRVVLRSGTSIDRWKYSALSGSFYEFDGIATEPLPEETVSVLNEIFGIE